MKIAATAIALLAATSIAAYAQTPAPAAPKAAINADQCWDMASNSVKNTQNKTAQQGANTSPGATGAATNPTTATPGGMAKSDSPANSMAQARPAGIPNC
jgi:hypothetical protein